MKLVIFNIDGSTESYEGVTALKFDNGTIEIDYINRFKISPEEDKELKKSKVITLKPESTFTVTEKVIVNF